MKILSTIRKILLHVCVVCSLVSITAKILDWYNPYMNFSGHVSGLQIYFQPKVSPASGKISSAEVLVRWLHGGKMRWQPLVLPIL